MTFKGQWIAVDDAVQAAQALLVGFGAYGFVTVYCVNPKLSLTSLRSAYGLAVFLGVA
jgi:hypothetical protein